MSNQINLSRIINDVDLQSTRLGPNPQKRNDRISAVMLRLAQVDLTEYGGGDALGDAYEYLIGQFASESGKKAGGSSILHKLFQT